MNARSSIGDVHFREFIAPREKIIGECGIAFFDTLRISEPHHGGEETNSRDARDVISNNPAFSIAAFRQTGRRYGLRGLIYIFQPERRGRVKNVEWLTEILLREACRSDRSTILSLSIGLVGGRFTQTPRLSSIRILETLYRFDILIAMRSYS